MAKTWATEEEKEAIRVAAALRGDDKPHEFTYDGKKYLYFHGEEDYKSSATGTFLSQQDLGLLMLP